MWLRLRNVEESNMSVFSSFLRMPEPCLLLGDPGLFINLPRNWFSESFIHSVFTCAWHSIPQSPCMSRVFKLKISLTMHSWFCTGFVLLFTPNRGHAPQSMGLKKLPTCSSPNSWTWHYSQHLPCLEEETVQTWSLLWCCLVAQLCPALLPHHGL